MTVIILPTRIHQDEIARAVKDMVEAFPTCNHMVKIGDEWQADCHARVKANDWWLQPDERYTSLHVRVVCKHGHYADTSRALF